MYQISFVKVLFPACASQFVVFTGNIKSTWYAGAGLAPVFSVLSKYSFSLAGQQAQFGSGTIGVGWRFCLLFHD